MVVAFFNNQVMVAPESGSRDIYSDPVPLNDNDRATCHLQTEYFVNGATLVYLAQVSNDGTTWADTTLSDSSSAAGLRAETGAVNGAFLRFKITFTAGGSGVGACCFDLHVLLDHV